MHVPAPRSAVAVAAALLFAACAPAEQEAAPRDDPTPQPTETVGTQPPGTPAPESPPPASDAPNAELFAFTAPTVGGGELDASVFVESHVALWFWAPW